MPERGVKAKIPCNLAQPQVIDAAEVIVAHAVDSALRALRELAERLDGSRTPVREALSRLAAEGLVDLVPHRGARVTSWSEDQLREIFELRLQLEPYAVAAAVPQLTAGSLDLLAELATRMSTAGKPGPGQDRDAIVDLNRQFHSEFVRLAHNAPLAASLRTVTHAGVVRQNFHDYDDAALARSLAHHHEMVAAARAGEPEWAAAIMRAHLYNARATMLRPAGGA